jgi:DNA-directed RNA polymerase omega subunit
MKTPDFVNSVDTDKCVANIGTRFELVLVAAIRARELKHGRGNRKMVTSPNSHIVSALQEIEAGHVGREYLKKVR